MAYVPTHARQAALVRGPSYALPDTDPNRSMSEGDRSPRPAKRRREDASSGRASSSRNGSTAAVATAPAGGGSSIVPSIFGVTARNEFTERVGNFIMAHCRGRSDVEIEIKLGTQHAPGPGAGHRVRLPSLTEIILPPDYPMGSFTSTLTKHNHKWLNEVLNQQVEATANTPHPLRYKRERQIDEFHKTRAGKVRVSREMENGKAGRVIAVVRKNRLGDLNVVSPNHPFDWRISCNVEEPVEIDVESLGDAESSRQKDRLCYEHQLCQVDLTAVTPRDRTGHPGPMSFELEVEVRDAPALIAEGEKDAAGQPNLFEDMLQSILDSVRILVKNAAPQ
ncbi:hypothetical protein CcaverHIS002_0112200 [Cutaneotrichosporon cavernicola]|uniref:mRNA-capping enzyme subunit beta n=1 Tax=Cutaneotrichosporon cavernicola TaxID=279322 RepID=A0AA48L0P8_9TREE|nr:uncharacterized protein CcaverHIS019_0112080 [Cutaneotrichosporon cavernicola]BEI80691.1 hypothetical protein CcaverHIS002_0112200 [Cutaneotrichosporon cavernicola]BEI88490.1 hypothetical protein CcaverHIS019_0112080 [Cutaneotrichosporon cavernicola]BEI96263.1 hypothetical protein CcaverHIS631_0112120 [Cutaneotrichosporon cavernicola]BEJ04035.1 hypothetical protein CcaverHIS641_0112100 [Cutaneotrichosporon cavernicola]